MPHLSGLKQEQIVVPFYKISARVIRSFAKSMFETMKFCVWCDLCENTKAYVVLMKSCVFFCADVLLL